MPKSKFKLLFRHRDAEPTTTYDYALRLVRSVIGFTVLAVGIIMLVTPGPAIVVIPLGLMILATEYAWARRYLKQFKEGGEKLGAILFTRKKKEQKETE
ncbi:PGPGW domain-containing protein [bacterium]|nr:PGPGW domain-containing protein [bacterium]